MAYEEKQTSKKSLKKALLTSQKGRKNTLTIGKDAWGCSLELLSLRV